MKPTQVPKETPVPVKIANPKPEPSPKGVKIRGTGAATKGLRANGPMA